MDNEQKKNPEKNKILIEILQERYACTREAW